MKALAGLLMVGLVAVVVYVVASVAFATASNVLAGAL